MRIYLQPPQPSRGLQRIADALTRYLPDGWEVTPHVSGADLVILYAVGRHNRLTLITEAIKQSKFQKYAIIQVCLKSTMAPQASQWIDIWSGAEAVWSYYDLQAACDEDDGFSKYGAARDQFNFYHAPLGADAGVFYDRHWNQPYSRDFIIATSGLSRLSESVREAALAAESVGRRLFHLGAELRLPGQALCLSGMSDDVLACYYSRCEFVSGLRRKEGFELPAVEGLLCGARPIVFNAPDYRWNYGNHAIYIEETDRQGVIDQLVQLFKHGAPPVTPEERELAVERYNWETIIKGFYERIA